MRVIGRTVAVVLLMLPCLSWAQAAKSMRANLNVALTYNTQRSQTTTGNNFWPQGGSAEIMATFYRGLGIAADITATHIGDINNTGVGLTLVTSTFGPTYTWVLPRHGKSQRQWTVFGESLIGIANGADSAFPNPNGVQSGDNSLALQTGGGVDLNISRHIALRLLQADWLRTQLPNAGSNVQNNLQLGAGIVFHLPGIKN